MSEITPTVTSMAPLLVDVEVAARLLSLPTAVVQNLIDDGELVAVKIGDETRIGVAGLHAYVEQLVITQYAGTETLGEAFSVIEDIARGRRTSLEDSESSSSGTETPTETLVEPATESFGLSAYL